MEQSDYDKAIMAKLLSLASILFSRGICRDFRRPVELLYPTLKQEYRARIRHPMDFGTLLFNCYKGKISVNMFREAIKLVCGNAITFNKDLYDVVGLAMHVEFFAAIMFEELLQLPYRPTYANQIEFTMARGSNRMGRYQLVKDSPLLESELRDLVDVLQRWPHARAPRELTTAVGAALRITASAVAGKHNRKPVETDSVSLSMILEPILKATQGASIPLSALTELINAAKIPSLCYLFIDLPIEASEMHLPEIGNQGQLVAGPKPEIVPWLRAIDEALGRLLVLIVERCLRGCPLSSMWARPVSCVWIQSSRFAQKAPAMVLAGSMHSIVPALLTETNLSRLPMAVARQLMNTLPKRSADGSASGSGKAVGADVSNSSGASDSSTSSNPSQGDAGPSVSKLSRMIPNGVVLVEIFGTHDLYWVRSDAVTPFEETYQSIAQSPRSDDNSVQEALQVLQWMEDEQEEIPASADMASVGDVLVPSPDVLEAMLLIRSSDFVPTSSNSNEAQPATSNSHAKKAAKAQSVTGNTSVLTFQYKLSLDDDSAMSSRRGRAMVKTRAMLAWVDSFKPVPEIPAPATTSTPSTKSTKSSRSSADSEKKSASSSAAVGATPGSTEKRSYHRKNRVDDQSGTGGNTDGAEKSGRKRSRHSNGERARESRQEVEPEKTEKTEGQTPQEETPHHAPQKRQVHSSAEIHPYGCHIGGCTRYANGVGALSLREVDFDAPIFFKESKNCNIRKIILRSELSRVQSAIAEIHARSSARESSLESPENDPGTAALIAAV